MANSYNTNPIIIDTFLSDIDIGNSLFGNSNATFFLNSIEWAYPANVSDTAVITDGNNKHIFNEMCVIAKQSIIKYFFGQPVNGIKIATSGVSSGKIIIFLK